MTSATIHLVGSASGGKTSAGNGLGGGTGGVVASRNGLGAGNGGVVTGENGLGAGNGGVVTGENGLGAGNGGDVTGENGLGARVVALLSAFPGIETLTGLVAIDPTDLNQSSRIDYLSALERQSAWLQAVMQRAIVAVAGAQASSSERIWDGIDDAEREDVATALRLSGSTAQMRIDVARTLVNHLPNTCSALAMGEISASQGLSMY